MYAGCLNYKTLRVSMAILIEFNTRRNQQPVKHWRNMHDVDHLGFWIEITIESYLLVDANSIQPSVHDIHPTVLRGKNEQSHQRLEEDRDVLYTILESIQVEKLMIPLLDCQSSRQMFHSPDPDYQSSQQIFYLPDPDYQSSQQIFYLPDPDYQSSQQMFHSPDPDYQSSQQNFIYLTQIIKVASKYFFYLTQIIKVVFVIGPFIIVAFVNATCPVQHIANVWSLAVIKRSLEELSMEETQMDWTNFPDQNQQWTIVKVWI